MKLCKDCKHMLVGGSGNFICGLTITVDRVYGTKHGVLCRLERMNNGDCRPDGKLFEKKLGYWKRLFS